MPVPASRGMGEGNGRDPSRERAWHALGHQPHLTAGAGLQDAVRAITASPSALPGILPASPMPENATNPTHWDGHFRITTVRTASAAVLVRIRLR